MFGVLKKIFAFAGKREKLLVKSMIVAFVGAVFSALQVVAMMFSLDYIVSGQISKIWFVFSIMLVSIIGRAACSYYSTNAQTETGYFMVAEKRIHIGDRLRYIPMGFFNKNSIGNITAIVTTTLNGIENTAARCLVLVLGGFLNTLALCLMMVFADWRIALLAIVGVLAYLVVTELSQRAAMKTAPARQHAQEGLVAAVLEYIQGMGVVKAFGLGKMSGKAVNKAIKESADANIILESVFSSLTGVYQTVSKLAKATILIVAPYLLLGGELTPVKCLLLLVSSFMIYSSVELVGSMASVARVIDASLDRMDTVMDTPVLDEHGTDIQLDHYDIKLEHVSFAYEQENVLRDVSMTIPEKTTCAIVGPSGSGKTTLVSLVARFWDVQKGSIRVGGHDVKDFTCDSLLKHFSIVFQNVYLFEDTIENNIKFGRPDSTHEEVVEAAKKACCHDFISALPEGYHTIVGEGGASLSGGERQRISIARAILKDAPIIILDEATASVDPENEQELQVAIAELTKDKTIIMIAHRLSTVRNADQIIVLNKGEIVQYGTHNELMKQQGLYSRFVNIREQAIGWRLEGGKK